VKAGGFDFVLDRERLVALGKVVPGKSGVSELFQMVDAGKMPPAKSKLTLSAEEKAILARWIDGGAPAFQTITLGPLLTEADLFRLVRADLETMAPRQRRFMRYFTLAHLASAGATEEDLKGVRLALAKLLNSLSWHPRLATLEPINPNATVLRLDLRDLKWNPRLWDRALGRYPYRIDVQSPDAREARAATGTDQPHVRADWFLANASRPPLYYDLLQMPSTDRGLESLLQVDSTADIETEAVVRSGFNGSGVSRNNRLLERHDAAFGAYWKTYDFSDNRDRQNLFEHPLGPPPARNSFVHAGGEMIFHLPNGLFGYLLADGNGRRLDRAPTEIVSDPRRPDRAVEAGLSCFSCHAGGYLPKADQVRAHVQKNLKAFGKEDAEAILTLYPPDEKVQKLLDGDNRRYRQALTAIGLAHDAADPVNASVERYEAVVTLASAAAEAGLTPADFARRLARSPELNRPLGSLRAGGTVQRQTFETAFVDLARAFGLADTVAEPAGAAPPFIGHTGTVNAVALSADGRRALSGGVDGTVRLWDEAGRELACFKGHRSAITAVALSADGRWALSGGDDRTVRLWDTTDGREVQKFPGHTDRITCVAFTPDNCRAISGSRDRTLRLWGLDTGEEEACLTGHADWALCVAVSPDGSRAISGGKDRTIRLWDLGAAKPIQRFGVEGEVYAVAFSHDGKKFAAGGNDRVVRLWDVDGKEVWRARGHGTAIIGIEFGPGDRQVLSVGSQYQMSDRSLFAWQIEDGQEATRRDGPEAGTLSGAAFSGDGRRILTIGPEMKLGRLAE
jgi:hypothetical protein